MKSFSVKRILLATVLSIVVNIIVLLIGRAAFPAPETFGPYTYNAVITLTAGGVIAAGIVYYLMASFWTKKFPQRNVNKDYSVLAYIMLVLSFIPDILLPFSAEADDAGATWPIVVVLCIMHVTAALICIKMFTKKEITNI